MCVPGTIEAVRSHVAARGAGGRRAAARPARGAARRRGSRARNSVPSGRAGGRAAECGKQGAGPDARLPRRHPDVPGRAAPVEDDLCDCARERLLRADLELLGAHGHAPRRARALHRRRPHDAAAHARRVDGADRRDRHLRARGDQSGHRRHDRRPAPLRARARKDQAWLARGDELGLGRPSGQRGGVPEHRRLRDDALPRLERGCGRVADRRAQHRGNRGRHAQPRSRERDRVRRARRASVRNKFGIENLANLGAIPPKGATAFVGVIPWEDGSGGPARVVATW